jgi:N-glycosylase/DNA lyase
VKELRAAFESCKTDIRQRLAKFTAVNPDEYFFEMAYCILTPQSSAIRAAAAVNALRALDRWDDQELLARTLARKEFYIRFHHTKARRLAKAHAQFPEIAAHLETGREGRELRTWLVAHVGGLGWKEASHFLRNIGYRDMAILDRHILKNLQRHGIISSLPRTLTRKNYLAIEQRFAQFCEHVGLTMDEVDLLFWSSETGQILK